MKKYLKRLFVTSMVGICLTLMMVSLGSCQELPKVEVLFSPEQGEEILQTLESAIQNTEERVYIFIYSFTLDELAEAIMDKHEEGLDVRVIMDEDQAGPGSSIPRMLQQAQVPLRIMDGSKGGSM